MTSLLKKWLPIFVALFAALAVVFSYLFPTPLVLSYRDRPSQLHAMLIDWAVIISGFVFILGALNIARVHAGRVLRRKRGWPYSVVLLIALVVAIVALKYALAIVVLGAILAFVLYFPASFLARRTPLRYRLSVALVFLLYLPLVVVVFLVLSPPW